MVADNSEVDIAWSGVYWLTLAVVRGGRTRARSLKKVLLSRNTF